MSDSSKFTVMDAGGQVFARYGSFPDALKGARWLLADDAVKEARIEWAENGATHTRSVSRSAGGEAAGVAVDGDGAAAHRLDVGMFRPSMTGAVITGAVALLAWALVQALQVLAGS